MLDKIMSMGTTESFQLVSQELLSKEARATLRNDLTNSGIVLQAMDMWSAEEIERFRYDPSTLRTAFMITNKEPDGKKLVHRLQLLCLLNPGLTEHIAVILERSCL